MDRWLNSSDKVEVKLACGHTKERHKKGNSFDKLAATSAARKLCDACTANFEAKRERMIADSIRRAYEACKSIKLTGSKKQVARAERIRERWLFELQCEIPPFSLGPSVERASTHVLGKEQALAVQQAITGVLASRLKAIDEVLAHGEAAWWIDWRDQLSARINKTTDAAIRSPFELLLESRI
jgi:hypothetical protein